MGVISMKQLLEAGVHFGHQTRRWNPKMAEYIFTERNGIYIIDLQKTAKKVEEAYAFIRDVVLDKKTILFVGTKKQAQEAIAEDAKRVEMFYVNNRWLGGMLTNFGTIRLRVGRLLELRQMTEDGTIDSLPKKEAAKLSKERDKLDASLGGLVGMEEIPDAIFVVDMKHEHIAVDEARGLGLPVVAIVDTNCDPRLADFPIPGNDDAIRAIRLFASKIAEAVLEGQQMAQAEREMRESELEAAATEKTAAQEEELLSPEAQALLEIQQEAEEAFEDEEPMGDDED